MKKSISYALMIGVIGLGALVLHGCKQEEPIMQSEITKKFNIEKVFSERNIVPVVVIGAGPGGLSAALYSAAQYDTMIVKGQVRPSLLEETSYVDNWLGSPHELGMVIIERAREQVKSAGARFVDRNVESVDFKSWPYTINFDDGESMKALAVIVATGAHPRMLNIPGERQFWGGGGVSACARCDAAFYEGQDVVVIGGGDAAVEEATELARYAKKVTMLHRRDKLRATAVMQDRLANYPQIDVKYNTEVKEIVGDDNGVNGVVLYDNKSGKTYTMPTNGVFLAIGHEPNTALFKGQLKLDDEGYVELRGTTREASVTGVFAAGEAADKVYRQAITSAGQGAEAAIEATKFLESTGFNLQRAEELKKRQKGLPVKDLGEGTSI